VHLTRLQRITLILFLIVISNWLMIRFTGYSLIGGDLFLLFLVVSVLLLAISLIWPLFEKWFSKN
jgi:hypothetical protein